MSVLRHTPAFSTTDAAGIARALYGIRADVDVLAGERDQNFLLRTADEERFVLKIANSRENRALLEAQNAALQHLSRAVDICPSVCRTLDGRTLALTPRRWGAEHLVRLLTWIPGVPLAAARRKSPQLLEHFGRAMAAVDTALATFDHPAVHREFHWDLAGGCTVIRERLSLVSDEAQCQLIARLTDGIERRDAGTFAGLRRSVVHNDPNDHNILIGPPEGDPFVRRQQVVGLLDFGDMVWSYAVADLAIAIAYAILGQPDIVRAAAAVIGGYHAVRPLQDDEVASLFGLVVLRLCTSVVIAAEQQTVRPDDPYLTISQRPIREVLPRLAAIPPRFATAAFRDACGWPPLRRTLRPASASAPLIAADLSSAVVLDLSVSSPLVSADPAQCSEAALLDRVGRLMGSTDVGVSRYGEAGLSATEHTNVRGATEHTAHTERRVATEHTAHTELGEPTEHTEHTEARGATEHTEHTEARGATEHTAHTELGEATEHTEHTEPREATEHTAHTEVRGATEHTAHAERREATEHAEHTEVRGATEHTEHTEGRGATEHTEHTEPRGATEHTAHTELGEATEHTAHTEVRGATEHTAHTERREATEHAEHTEVRGATEHTEDTQPGEATEHTEHTEHTGWRRLGVELFAAGGTAIQAPVDGLVHSTADSAIVLAHADASGAPFYTILRGVASDVTAGQQVGAGDRVASFRGERGALSRIRVQVVLDRLDLDCGFPECVPADKWHVWSAFSPDPAALLGLRTPLPRRDGPLARRRERIGSNVRVGYRVPLNAARGWMQYLYDDNGRRYLDAYNNVPHVGHCHPRVVAAAANQMRVLNTNTRYPQDVLVEYADRLCATLPELLRVCYFVNSGSEANELALRLARAHSKQDGVIVLDAAYHGNTTTLVAISPYKFNGPGGDGAPDWVRVAALPDVYRGPHKRDPVTGTLTAGRRYARDIADAARSLRAGPHGLAAFIAESAPSVAGQIVLPDGYLRAAYEIVRRSGGVCIADEVQTAYGRMGDAFYAFEAHHVVPDIVVLGKPIGNGHPIGAVVTTRAIARSFDNGMEFFSTFGGNTVSCAVGLAVLDVVHDEGLMHHARDVGDVLLERLRHLSERHPLIGDVRGRGLFLGVELVKNRDTLEPAGVEAEFVVNRMREEGVLIGTEGPHGNVLKIRPPMPFTADDAETLCRALDRALIELE